MFYELGIKLITVQVSGTLTEMELHLQKEIGVFWNRLKIMTIPEPQLATLTLKALDVDTVIDLAFKYIVFID